MNSRAFTTKVDIYNRIWLGELLGFPSTSEHGPDLIDLDNRMAIEIKAKLRKYRENRWTIHNYQFEAFPQDFPIELYWAFWHYDLAKEISDIAYDEDLEPLIEKRCIWFTAWSFAETFSVSYPESGVEYRYVNRLPRNRHFREFVTNDGSQLFVPRRSRLERRIKRLGITPK